MTTFLRGLWTLLSYLAVHKWLVLVGCVRRGLLWRGLVHDWSKVLPDEFVPTLMGYNLKRVGWGDRLKQAVRLHQARHDHHWEYYTLTRWVTHRVGPKPWPRYSETLFADALEMPCNPRVEMVCDWRAAAHQRGNDVREWYEHNRWAITLHPNTRAWVEKELGIRG